MKNIDSPPPLRVCGGACPHHIFERTTMSKLQDIEKLAHEMHELTLDDTDPEYNGTEIREILSKALEIISEGTRFSVAIRGMLKSLKRVKIWM
jgi:hypothetical protein